jgi:small nuclear ribonucleoprotein (snRNP)-like protein
MCGDQFGTMASTTAAGGASKKKNNNNIKAHAKTLGSVLRHYEGMELIVELKTGRMYRGTVASADEYMNITLDDVEDARGSGGAARGTKNDTDDYDEDPPNTYPSSEKKGYSSTSIAASAAAATGPTNITIPILSSMYIKGPKIRYIHFPDSADLSALIRRGLDRDRAAANMYNRGKRK